MDFASAFLLLAVALFVTGYILQKHRTEEESRQPRVDREKKEREAFGKAWEEIFPASADNPAKEPTRRALAAWFGKRDYLSASDFDALNNAWKKGALLVAHYPDWSQSQLAAANGLEKTFLAALLKGKPLPQENDRLAHNRRRNLKEAERAREILTSASGRTPNPSQAAAAVDLDDRTLVLAGAGTGKTATIVAKVLYLVKSGHVRPDEILLLAYNREAANEMRERLRAELAGETLDVHTFHSFGNALLAAEDGPKHSLSTLLEEPAAFETMLIELFETLIAQDAAFRAALVHYLTERDAPLSEQDARRFCRELIDEKEKLTRLTGLVRTFLPLFKDSGLSLHALHAKAQNGGTLARFLTLFEPLYVAYEARLQRDRTLDFGDMIARATRRLEAGLKLPYKFVLVDEFQDLSRSRAKLLLATLAAGNATKLFAVGDDWQSIYRFSGADTRYVSAFERIFGRATVLTLDTTYRFPEELHTLTADFVTRNPAQLKKVFHAQKTAGYPCALLRDVRTVLKTTPAKPSLASPRKGPTSVAASEALAYREAIDGYLSLFAQKVRERQGAMNRVMIVGRRRRENMPALSECPTVSAWQHRYPELEILYSTAHAAKGLEADYVILVGNEAGLFPSVRETDPIVEAVLPEAEPYPYAEERRLFYVAMTRAKHFLVILYNGERESLFVSELKKTATSELLKSIERPMHQRSFK